MASRGVNKVIIIGRLGKDPEVRYTQGGSAICNITVATSESWRDKATGERKELTEWHRVALFGKVAEVAGEYLTKGSEVYIEGQLKTRKWQDQSGQDRYVTEIVVQGYSGSMQMLSTNSGQSPQQPPQQQQQQQPRQNQSEPRYNNPPVGLDFDDDIPF